MPVDEPNARFNSVFFTRINREKHAQYVEFIKKEQPGIYLIADGVILDLNFTLDHTVDFDAVSLSKMVWEKT